MNKACFTIKETAEYINMSESFIRKLVLTRDIPFFRMGYRIMFRKDALDQWLKEKEEKNTSNNNLGL